jgi:hypothetical protein
MSILQNENRIGNFTSSNAYLIMATDKTGKNFSETKLTYIEEVNMERELGISLGTESSARPLEWGKHCEQFAFDEISTDYVLTADTTLVHPDYDFWSGSPDGHTNDTVMDLKCPMTRKSFFKLVAGENIYSMVDGFDRNGAKYKKHSDGAKYYWQLVSNAILTGKKCGELIVYMPYLKDLQDIKSSAKDLYNWIYYAADIELPYIHEDGAFKNVSVMRFDIPQKDIDALTEKMVEASKFLIPRNTTPVTIHDTANENKVIVHDKI